MKSLVIGFCKCARCGWTNGKFNWHVLFKCPECGSYDYVNWRDPFEFLEEKRRINRNDRIGNDYSRISYLSDRR